MSDRSFVAARSASPVSPFVLPLRRLLDRLLNGVRAGSISIELPDGHRADARGAAPGPHAAITLQRWRALRRLALQGDIGLAESYRDGDWSTPDLVALLEFGARNDAGWAGAVDGRWPVRALARLLHLAHANSRRGSRHNIAFHYDIGNAFYARWLDPQLIYSSALYRTAGETLEQAQAAKLERVIDLLELDRTAPDAPASVLEIGCGWGALALAIARRHDVRLTGLTLSAQQLAFAQQRAAAEGGAGRIDLRLQDYRDVDGRFDRIVSIEMLEAVGERYWPTYFQTLQRRLRPGGVAVIQAITIGEPHFERYRRGADFIQRYIFPGGMLLTKKAMDEQGKRVGLMLENVENFRLSYAKTLRLWRERFLERWHVIKKLGFDEQFRRKWVYYLSYCEAGFEEGSIDVGIYQYRKPA